MTRSIKPMAWVLMGVGVLVLTAGAAAFRRAPSAPVAPPLAEVSVQTVVPETVSARYEYVGQAEASRSVEVRSQVTGVIVARPYAEGTDVAKGTLLFRIGLIGRGVDPKQQRPLCNVGAFRVGPGDHHPGDLRADLDRARGLGLADGLVARRHGLGGHREDGHFGGGGGDRRAGRPPERGGG